MGKRELGMIGETPSLPDPDASVRENAPTPTAGLPAEDTQAKEIGGRDGPEPTRYGDWEKNGRCIDF